MQPRTFPSASAAGVIVLNTVVGLTLGIMLDPIMEAATAWLVFAVLCIVAISEIVVVRLVVNANVEAVQRGDGMSSLEEVAASLTTLTSTFAVAPSIYGIVSSVFMGSPWPAIPLSAIGLLLLVLNAQFATARIAAARREMSARGLA
jgi:hypothetical protein